MIAGIVVVAGVLCVAAFAQLSTHRDPLEQLRLQQEGVVVGACGKLLAHEEVSRGLSQLLATDARHQKDIEVAVGSIVEQGRKSRYYSTAKWILRAYAHRAKSSAYSTLRLLLESRDHEDLQQAASEAAGIALGLTKYVTAGGLGDSMSFCRRKTPVDSLARLVAEWISESGVPTLAIGFRFDGAEFPAESADSLFAQEIVTLRSSYRIRVAFTDQGGKDCAEESLSFRLSGKHLEYLIQEKDTIRRHLAGCFGK